MKGLVLGASLGVALFAIGCSGGDTTSAAPQPAPTPAKSPTPTPATALTGYKGVQAIWTGHCMPCHNAGRPKGMYDLTTYAGTMKGGTDGVMVVAGKPKDSKLMGYLSGKIEPKMPKNGDPLSDADMKVIADWITAGAKDD